VERHIANMDGFLRKYNYNTNFARIFMKREIKSADFLYHLPEDRIASHPLAERDQSKLLVYNKGEIKHHRFSSLPDLLPINSSLFFNDTKVIPARLIFQKETGSHVEVFLLQPAQSGLPLQHAMQATRSVQWVCTIGNLKRWKEGYTIQSCNGELSLSATLLDKSSGLVKFYWEPVHLNFAEVVEEFGDTPLPPYLNRAAEENDKTRYQTVYSHHEGAVAAPTAGLHFTESVLERLKALKMITEFLTLHVSAGTFKPIKTENALEHVMHAEQIVVTRSNIEVLMLEDRKIVAVGTTAMRTLESLYWYGVKILKGNKTFEIDQNAPYNVDQSQLPSKKEALSAVLEAMGNDNRVIGQTSIFIVPGYQFRICNGLITNFHQPGSTLMLLVAAFVGDHWNAIYKEAIDRDYRFLSYGDSSLLMP